MPKVTMTIPKILAELVHGGRTFHVEASTVAESLDAAMARHPELRVHLFDETRRIRRHVTCFPNDAMCLDLQEPVADGDTVTVVQAVSGGFIPLHP